MCGLGLALWLYLMFIFDTQGFLLGQANRLILVTTTNDVLRGSRGVNKTENKSLKPQQSEPDINGLFARYLSNQPAPGANAHLAIQVC